MTNTLGGKKLVFLVGASRSGTTWLHMLLGQSPAVMAVLETHMFSVYLRSCFDAWDARAGVQYVQGLHNFLSVDQYYRLLRDFATGALSIVAEAKPSASIILEKSPQHALVWKSILAVFPDAHFLHIVRDPRAVVASLLAASDSWGSTWAPKNVATASRFWKSHVESACAIRSATSNYYQVRYKDLMGDGLKTLKNIFDWIGINATSEECQNYIAACEIERLKSDATIGAQLNIEDPAAFFRFGSTESWKSELSPRQVAIIEDLTEPLLSQLGYQTEPRSHFVQWSARASLAAADFRRTVGSRLRSIVEKV